MRFVSIVSGTSTDGISVACVDIEGFNLNTRYRIIDGSTVSFPNSLRNRIISIAENHSTTAQEISAVNWKLGQFISRSTLSMGYDFDVISYSGHTIFHGPSVGKVSHATFQIGEISILVAMSGKTAVTDYRITDVAQGGLGAPLIAFSDYIIFRKDGTLTLNIGGIANITYLGKDGPLAFDTGPGNMLIDAAMMKYYGKRMDTNGITGKKGRISSQLLHFMMNDEYLSIPPPKNTGREYFGEDFLARIDARFPNVSREDKIRTITRYTAESIHHQVESFIPEPPRLLVVGGGGTKNPLLMDDIRELFGEKVRTFMDFGIRDDLREAIGFAILANQTLHLAAGRIKDVRNMSGPVLGKIIPGRNLKELVFNS